MNARHWVSLIALCVSGTVFAQPPLQPPLQPNKLPPSISGEPRTPLTTKPRDPEKERAEAIKALKEEVFAFDTATINVKKIENHWSIISDKGVLKDFGNDKQSAEDTAKLLRDLQVNQIGIVQGARPPMEYWLTDGKAPRPVLNRRIMLPIASKMLHAESIGGAWVLTDGARAFYDFGTNEDAAKQAAVVFWKYGFNQLGVIGSPNPTVLYPLCDPYQLAREQQLPTFTSSGSPLQVANDVARTSLVLPGNVYGGPRAPVDIKAVEIVKRENEYYLVNGKDTWGRFGTTEHQARTVLKLLHDARVDEVVKMGENEIPLFFVQGQMLTARPLGVTTTTFRTERVKVQRLRETWWLFEDSRPLIDCGTKKDAETILLVLKQFGIDTLSVYGRPDGGLRLLSKSR
jgi:hypothetical protein